MNRMALVATLLWLCSLAGALAQEPTREIPRDSTADLEPVLRYPLPEGALLHAQYDGEMMRVDGAGKRLAKAKIPDSHRIASSTVLVVSSNFSNVLMIHRADDSEFRANHRVWLFELGHLKRCASSRWGDASHRLSTERSQPSPIA